MSKLYLGCTSFREEGKGKPKFPPEPNNKKPVDRKSIKAIINENPDKVLTIPAENGGKPKDKEKSGEEK